jgi:membrane protein
MPILRELYRFFDEVIHEWNSDKVNMLAAALAYYAVFSVGPMLLIVIWVSGLVFGEAAVRGRVVDEINGLVGQQGAELIQTLIRNARETAGDTLASTIGFVTLLISSAALIRHLQTAINLIWDVQPPSHRGGIIGSVVKTVRDRFFSFAMVLGVGFLLMVALVISAAVGAINQYLSDLLPQTFGVIFLVNQTVSLVVFTGLFALIFKILPDAKVEWRDVLVGAFFSATLFNIGKYILGVYLGNSNFGSTYGAAGALVLLLAWIYYSSQILLLGAEITQVFARRYGSRIVSMSEDQDPLDNATDMTQRPEHIGRSKIRDRRTAQNATRGVSHIRTTNPALRRKQVQAQKLLAGLVGIVAVTLAFIFNREA